MNLLSVEGISKKYGEKDNIFYALNEVSLKIERGELITIMGPSGSGKSTLLNILGCLDIPTEGNYYLDNKLTSTLNKTELAKIRNEEIGFIFQHFGLLPQYTVLENVEMPLIYRNLFSRLGEKISYKKRKEKAMASLSNVGLEQHIDKYPSQLSGGQQQRVSIARALVGNPSVVLADEPTGALDQTTGKEIISLLQNIHREGKTIIIVTHDPKVASCCNRKITIQDGRIFDDCKIDGSVAKRP